MKADAVKILSYFLTIVLGTLTCSSRASAEDSNVWELVIVAGQSNAVGFDAKPSKLPKDDVDQKIKFWWRCGDPPPDSHDSTSGGKWTHLQPQPLGNPIKPRKGRQYGNFAQTTGGFGPEIGFARRWYSQRQRPLAIVKAAFSGTNLKHDWNPANKDEATSCYLSMVNEVRAAMKAAAAEGMSVQPIAFIWVQGESDANAVDAKQYSKRLSEMLSAVRKDLSAPHLKAAVAVNTKFGGANNKFMPTIVAQQKECAANDPLCKYVDTSAATIANGAHYDSAGTLLVGRLFAETLLGMKETFTLPSQPVTIVTLGDSITKGARPGVSNHQTFASLLEAGLRKSRDNVTVKNVGIGGERTDQAIRRLDQVIALKPQIVTVMYGTNDGYIDRGKTTNRISVEAYEHNLRKMVERLREAGVQPILMTEPRFSAKSRVNGIGENPNIALEPYIKQCRAVAREMKVPLVDHFAGWTKAKDSGVDLHTWTTDGCHPNVAGHKDLAERMIPIVSDVVQRLPKPEAN